MESDDKVIALLTEIRDIQREQADQYRRLAEHSVALQEASLARYEQFQAMYRRVLMAGAGIVVLLLLYLAVVALG